MTSPRAVEAAVRGRRPAEITALFGRLGGPDRTAHRVCACRALEAAAHAEAPEQVDTLRRLLCCAAWIDGHAAHLRLVQIPDLLDRTHAAGLEKLDRGLESHLVGAELAAAVGDGVLRAGGPYRIPDAHALTRLRPRLEDAVDAVVETVRWISGFDVPESALDIPLLALDDPVPGPGARGLARYPVDGGVGVLVSSGLGFPLGEFESFVSRPRSGPTRTGRAVLRGAKATLTGPLARNALCARLLHPAAREAAARSGLSAAERNPYRSALVRAVELVHALEEAIALIDRYVPPDPARPLPDAGLGRGCAAVETRVRAALPALRPAGRRRCRRGPADQPGGAEPHRRRAGSAPRRTHRRAPRPGDRPGPACRAARRADPQLRTLGRRSRANRDQRL